MSFFKKSGPSPEELARENSVKKSITENFKGAVKILQQEFVVSDEPIHSEDSANAVCNVLEAVFLHGLKDSFSTRAFWAFLQKFTHKDVVSQLNHLGQITTEVGMCRAWIRLALNDGVLESYMDAMLADSNTMKYYYKRFAYLRDLEHPGILKSYIQGIGHFTFQLSYNSSVLNIWTTTPLILAGLQEGLYTPPAVMVHSRNTGPRHTPIAARPMPSAGVSPRQTSKPSSSRTGRRRSKHHRSGARVVSPTSHNGTPHLPTVPQNTPLDPSELTSYDIDEIRKLTLLHKKSDDESSTATSLISHPDPIDARQNFSLPFDSYHPIRSPPGSSLPSTIVQSVQGEEGTGKTPSVVAPLVSSQDTSSQVQFTPVVSTSDIVDGEKAEPENTSSATDEKATLGNEDKRNDAGVTARPNGIHCSPGEVVREFKAPEITTADVLSLAPNLMDSVMDVEAFNKHSASSTLTPEGQSSKGQSSKLGSSPGQISNLFPVIEDDNLSSPENDVALPFSDQQEQGAGPEITTSCPDEQNDTLEKIVKRSSSSSLLEFSPAVHRKSGALDPEMSTATPTNSDMERRKSAILNDADSGSGSDKEQPPNSFNAEMDSRRTSEVHGNSLGMMEGWSSSPFEEKADAVKGDTEAELLVDGSKEFWESDKLQMSMGDESFNQLLESYGPSATPLDAPSMSQVLDALPESEREKRRLSSPPVTQPSTHTTDLEEDVFDEYEVIPDMEEINSMPTDPNTQAFLEIVGEISTEKGLDFQNYQCKGCGRPVGMFYGKARVCTYDACYYCYSCHENEEYYIPARILYNWDFRKHRVSKQSLIFLRQHEEDPLLDVQSLNSRIYVHVKDMHEVKLLRLQLRYLKTYLFSCKQSIADDLRRQIWPREYLYDDIHLYSLSDLLQVPTGTLAQSIRKALKFASKHVYDCRLCCQKGFICEICNNPKVIYPFEMDSTTSCERCNAVYHKACKTNAKSCPKCERRLQRRSKLGDSEDENTMDILDYAISPDSGLQLTDET